MEALTEVCEAGKVREIGVSEWTVEQIQAALDVSNTRNFVSSQPQYNMIWRAPEAELIPFCEEHGISQIVWSPLAQGVLTGKYKAGNPPPPGTRAAHDEMSVSISRYMVDPVLEAVQQVAVIAADAGLDLVELALAWVLRKQNVASAIIGASRPDQVYANAAASGIELSQEVLDAVDEALADVAIAKPQLAAFAREGVKHR
jgi:aryl-alcohol dehydrogenase-like predicted oxidoreductase